MALEIQGKVGPQGQVSSLSDGVVIDPWYGKQSQQIVQDFAPRYTEAAYRGFSFCGGNQSAQAVTALATTATGLILINPLGSGKNAFLIDITLALDTSALATFPQISLAANSTPAAVGTNGYALTTPLTVNPALLGSTPGIGPSCKLLSAATLPVAPVIVRQIWTPITSAAAQTGQVPYVKDELAGALGIAPGCAFSLTASAAVSLISAFTWIELPV
jgi:hypothetical protein